MDQTVDEGQLVNLDGSASHDPDQNPLTYLWQQAPTDPVQVTLSDSVSVNPSFTAPTGLSQDTTLKFNLVVDDGLIDSAADSMAVTVSAQTADSSSGTVPSQNAYLYSNIALLALVAASSENTFTGQLAVKAVDGVMDGFPDDYTKEWATANEKSGARLQLTWPTAHLIDRIILYDRLNTSDQILSATLTFSDGSTFQVGPLDNAGGANEYYIPARKMTGVTMTVNKVSSTTHNAGLSGIKVYGESY